MLSNSNRGFVQLLLVSLRPLPTQPPLLPPLPPTSCLLLNLPRRLLQARVALLVRPPRAEPGAHKCRPRPPLEQEHREDDAEAEAEGGLDDGVGQAKVPLFRLSAAVHIDRSSPERGFAGSALGRKTDLLVEKRLADGPGERARRRRRRGKGLRRRVGHCEGVLCVCVCVAWSEAQRGLGLALVRAGCFCRGTWWSGRSGRESSPGAESIEVFWRRGCGWE